MIIFCSVFNTLIHLCLFHKAINNPVYALNFPTNRVTASFIFKPTSRFRVLVDNEYRNQIENSLRNGRDEAFFTSVSVSFFPDIAEWLEFGFAFDNISKAPKMHHLLMCCRRPGRLSINEVLKRNDVVLLLSCTRNACSILLPYPWKGKSSSLKKQLRRAAKQRLTINH